jgi:hypothetical protein
MIQLEEDRLRIWCKRHKRRHVVMYADIWRFAEAIWRKAWLAERRQRKRKAG